MIAENSGRENFWLTLASISFTNFHTNEYSEQNNLFFANS